MRNLVVSTFVTLDGVMQAPGGPEEDPTGGFEYGGWSVNLWDDVMQETMGAGMAQPYDLLLGRRTYEIFAAHWPHVEGPMADALNSATKYVASTTLDRLTWSNSTLIAGDLATAVRELKAQAGPEIQVQGSSDLIQSLLVNDLVDEFRLWIFPVVVGPGKRLLGDRTPPATFTLADVKTSTTGVLMTTYRRAGALEPGSFALDEPTDAEIERRKALEAEEPHGRQAS